MCQEDGSEWKEVKNELCEINIEEVEVEPCLDNSGCHCDGVHYAFREISARKKKKKKRAQVVSVNGVERVSKLRIRLKGVGAITGLGRGVPLVTQRYATRQHKKESAHL